MSQHEDDGGIICEECGETFDAHPLNSQCGREEPPARRPSAPVLAIAKYLGEERGEDACQLLDEAQLQKLGMWCSEIESISAEVSLAPIANKADEGRAADLLNRGTIALKQLDELRTARVKPLNEEVRAVNGLFKVVTDKLEALAGKHGRLEKQLLAWRQVERARIAREQEEAQRKQREAAAAEAAAIAKAAAAKTEKARTAALMKAQEASQAQAAAALAEPEAMTKGTRTDVGTVSARNVWTAEIVDPDLVPREFCEPSLRLIRAAVASGTRMIAGVNIAEVEALSRRPGQ